MGEPRTCTKCKEPLREEEIYTSCDACWQRLVAFTRAAPPVVVPVDAAPSDEIHRQRYTNLRTALGVTYPTAEEVVGAALQAIHERNELRSRLTAVEQREAEARADVVEHIETIHELEAELFRVSGLLMQHDGDESHDTVSKHLAATLARATAVEQALDEARKEIAIDNQLLAERDKILDEFPCPHHGRCVPHVLGLLRDAAARSTSDQEGR